MPELILDQVGNTLQDKDGRLNLEKQYSDAAKGHVCSKESAACGAFREMYLGWVEL